MVKGSHLFLSLFFSFLLLLGLRDLQKAEAEETAQPEPSRGPGGGLCLGVGLRFVFIWDLSPHPQPCWHGLAHPTPLLWSLSPGQASFLPSPGPQPLPVWAAVAASPGSAVSDVSTTPERRLTCPFFLESVSG